MNLDRIIAVRNNKTVYRDGDRCLKVFNEDYSKADVLNEALNQARVEETGLHIPKILEVTVIDGKWTIVTEFIKGKTLSDLMKENPDKKEEYLKFFVDLQLEMHSKTCPLLNKLKDKMNRKISETDASADAILFSAPRPAYRSENACPSVQIRPPTKKALTELSRQRLFLLRSET